MTIAQALAQRGFTEAFSGKTVGQKTGQTYLSMIAEGGTGTVADESGVRTAVSVVIPKGGFDGDLLAAECREFVGQPEPYVRRDGTPVLDADGNQVVGRKVALYVGATPTVEAVGTLSSL